MSTYDLNAMSDYERQAWARIQSWRAEQAKARGLVPAVVRRNAKKVGDLAAKSWDAAPGTDRLSGIMGKVLLGGQAAVTDAVAASLQRERILTAAREAGAAVNELDDLHSLDLKLIDEILPSLNLRYATASALTGAGSGFVAGGGTAGILGTAGVGAAPGAAAVAADRRAAALRPWPAPAAADRCGGRPQPRPHRATRRTR